MIPHENNALRPGIFPLGNKGLIAFLAFLSAFIPLSIDLYLPAMPHMADFFATTQELTNFTLSFFMLFFAISMLLWGPFTDKYGRKPILYLGLGLYITGSLICVFSWNMYMLITGRVIQAIGSGAIQAVSMAIVKDNFQGFVMERVLVWIQTLTILCPMLAPVGGAFLLKFVSWRGLFVILALCGIFALVMACFLAETLKTPTAGSAFRSLGRIGVVLGNRGYLILLVIFSLMVMPVMSFLSTSSFIYMTFFDLSAEQYSYFFAFNGCFAMLAPLLYMRFLRRLPRLPFLTVCFLCVAISGLLIMILGAIHPLTFALLYIPVTFFGSACRPAGTMLLMNQMDTDNGTVGSLCGCVALLFGSFAMMLCSLDWPTLTMAVGAISLTAGALCTVIWLVALSRKLFRTTF